MPYIAPGPSRDALDDAARNLTPETLTDGELNYFITRVLLRRLGEHYTYSDIGSAVMALEMAKLEFYRRAAAPYEDKKCGQNGDVYV